MSRKNTVKINLQMSEDMAKQYQVLAEEIGIPRTGVMVMALKFYIDEQIKLEMFDMSNYYDYIADMESKK